MSEALSLEAKFKDLFFDRDKVQASLDRALQRGLSRAGAFVRKRAKSLLRYRKRSAARGQPPSVHRSTGFTRETKNRKTGETKRQPSSPLRELLLFGYDQRARSAVVGPVLGGSRTGAPEALEHGGVARKGGPRVGKHPFMGPALKESLPKLPPMIRDTMR